MCEKLASSSAFVTVYDSPFGAGVVAVAVAAAAAGVAGVGGGLDVALEGSPVVCSECQGLWWLVPSL